MCRRWLYPTVCAGPESTTKEVGCLMEGVLRLNVSASSLSLLTIVVRCGMGGGGGGEPAVLSSHSLSLMASVTPVPPCVREGVARLLQEM